MKKNIFGISLITITCMYGLFAGVVILAVMLLGGKVIYAVIGSIIVIVVQFLISPLLTDLVMESFYHADFKTQIPDYLKNFIEIECQKYAIKYPKIGIINDGAPNAFTYGRTKEDARIVLTKGIFELLDENEVISVIGHEIGHIVHMDMMVMTFAQLIPLILYAIYEICASKSTESKKSDKGVIVGYIAYIFYVVSQYVILWLSRTREYYADSFSIEETKNPNALANALVKIGFGLSVNHTETELNVSENNALGIMSSKDSKAMSISTIRNGVFDLDNIKNAMKWEMWNPWAKWFEFNSTHPLISKRLNAISNRSREFNQEPYIIFDLEKKESYFDDFILEIVINFLPKVFLFASVFVFIMCIFSDSSFKFMPFSICLLLAVLSSYIKFNRAHKKRYTLKTVRDLLSEVKVSHITSVPCILKGKIIGKGDPGCIFSEDFVIKDETGIMFLDYNQPLVIINKVFALFKSHKYIDKEVEVKGWYRRSPVPYVEIYEYTVDGVTKRVFTYPLNIFLYILYIIIAILFLFL